MIAPWISISVAKSVPQLITKKLRCAGSPVPGKGGEMVEICIYNVCKRMPVGANIDF